MKKIKWLVSQGRFKDAAAVAVFEKKTYATRYLFQQDKQITNEKIDAIEDLLLADSPTDFDAYCRYLDFRQPLARNFYLDRRKYLKDISDAITNMYFPKKGVPSYDVLRIKLRTRSGKSEIFNRAAFWVQGILPNGETLHCVGGGMLKNSIHAKRAQFISEYWDRHIQVFPGTIVRRDSKSLTSVWFRNSEYPDIATVTVGGSIEGYVQATNLLILDDLVASNEVNSIKKLTDIYELDINSAIERRVVGEPKRILIGTPIATQTGMKEPLDRHYDDLVGGGHLCKEFIVPSLNDNMISNYAFRNWDTRDGKPVWDFTTEQFLRARETAYFGEDELRISNFETLFQMRSMQVGIRVFSKVLTFTEEPRSKYRDVTIFDPADKGDDSAQAVHVRIYDSEPNLLYVIDSFRSKKPMDRERNGGFIEDFIRFLRKNNTRTFWYEENLGGTLLGNTIVEVSREIGYEVRANHYRQVKNKIQRIHDNSLAIIDRVRLWDIPPHDDYADSVVELRMWNPKAKHDDFPDVLTRVVEQESLEIKENVIYPMGRRMF